MGCFLCSKPDHVQTREVVLEYRNAHDERPGGHVRARLCEECRDLYSQLEVRSIDQKLFRVRRRRQESATPGRKASRRGPGE